MKKLIIVLFAASLVSCNYRLVPKSGPYFTHKAKKEAAKMRDTAKNIKVVE